MPGSRRSSGNSRSASQPATPRQRRLDDNLDTRGRTRSSRGSRSRTRGSSAPPTPYRSAKTQSGNIFKPTCDKKVVTRVKKMGYDHAGAISSASDLLHMAPTWVAVSERADPWGTVAAGVKSDRMAELSRCDIEDHHFAEIPVYAPSWRSDPISHMQFPSDKHMRDVGKMLGAAGVRTDRLTFLNQNWITQHTDPAKRTHEKEMDWVYHKTDPISHTAPDPLLFQPNEGIKQVEEKESKVPLFHMGVRPKRLSDKEAHQLLKSKQVTTCSGQVLYNVAGEEDMLPAATVEFTKADKPPTSQHKRENDKKLPAFFRLTQSNRQSPTLGQSEDMYYSMYGTHRAEKAMEKANDKPLTEIETMCSTMLGGKRPTPSDMEKFAGVLNRAIELRSNVAGLRQSRTDKDIGFYIDRNMPKRPSDAGSPRTNGSPMMPYPVAAQTYREAASTPASTQRRQSDPSGLTRKAQSVDAYSRRSRTGGSVAGSDVGSYVSVGRESRGFEYTPRSARTRRAKSTDEVFRMSTTAGSAWGSN